jgi:RNA polymerase sigma factor (sigma-70 family)
MTMSNAQAGIVLQHIRGLLAAEHTSQLPDRLLLERFTQRREEEAFAALVRRHGPLVHSVCRRVLGNAHDAEDAFQAAFLVLARKADCIRQQNSLGCWLYRVAYHTAVQARRRAADRQRHERQVPLKPTVGPLTEVTGRELLAVLDEELRQLAERHRAPLVLCCLEGKTRDEAAQELGWSLGTLKRRLEQARERLRQRLTRRGLTLPAALLTATLAQGTATASISAALANTTVGAAMMGASGQATGTINALANSVAHTPRTARLGSAMVVALIVGAIALGLSLSSAPTTAQSQGGTAGATDSPRGRQQPAPPTPQRAEGKMTVQGRVLDADGKPVAEAPVAVVAEDQRTDYSWRARSPQPEVLGQTRTAADGRFLLTVPQTSSNRQAFVKVLAAVPGHGLSEIALDPDAARQDVTLRLGREHVVRGRLLDLQGVPAANVRVSLVSLLEQSPRDGPNSFLQRPAGLASWPAAVKTDAQGRVELRGLRPGLKVTLAIHDDRYAHQTLEIATSGKEAGAPFTWSLAPVQVLEGRVVCDDTGRAVPNIRLRVESLRVRQEGNVNVRSVHGPVDAQTDDEGRFRINPLPGDEFRVTAYAPPGQPYLTYAEHFVRRKGAVKQDVEVRLPRGTLVRGTVKEAGSGKPVAGARIYFHRRQEINLVDAYYEGFYVPGVTDAEGKFRMAVLARPGTLLVAGPTWDFLHVETNAHQLARGRPGGQRWYPDALREVDLKPGEAEFVADFTLRRGVTVKGTLVGPDGRPVKDALMYCRTQLGEGFMYRGWPWRITDGRFELPGCDPDKGVPVFFLAPRDGLGAVVELPGKQPAGDPITVRLQRCGSATIRFADKKGKPQARFEPTVSLVLTPGISLTGEPVLDKGVGTDVGYLPRELVSRADAEGRMTLGNLIPGATYRVVDWESLFARPTNQRDFSVQPGQAVDLGTLTIKRQVE